MSLRTHRWLCLLSLALFVPARAASVDVVVDPGATPRELYGASRLRLAVAGIKLQAVVRIVVGAPDAARFKPGESGAFRLVTQGQEILVSGSDPAGVLYGCLELIRRVSATGVLPGRLDVTDRPAFKIRGTNLFLMKSGEKGYDWPITRENFPWFFDRSLMGRYLDQLVESRYNTIFFWNGHPFPYLLELGRYPEARMLGDAELRRNIEHFRWFTREADRRGIWTVLHFYNIHVPPSFAKAHEKDGVRVQNPAPTPLLNAYMRYATSEFVNSYPSVGLMLTAGEALRVNQEEFVRDAIIAGIKDTGKHPPLIVRQWAIDADRYREVVRSQYDNLFTMMKHNTEMLVSPHPDPRNQEWVSFNQNHIINLHENSDVKPFRWGSPVFIRQMVSAWKQMGASGYHIYPMVSWLWPQSLDKAEPGILTLDRDWIWIEAFGRYGWNPDRAPAEEESFWKQKLARRFGSPDAANAVYDYYVRTGPILPGLQNMVSIVNMNWHPTAVSQEASLQGILVSDRTYGPGLSLTRPLDDWTLDALERKTGPLSPAARQSPPLSVKDFVKQTLASKPAEGVPPLALADLFVENALGALKGLEAARAAVRNEPNGYARFETDARAILQLAKFYRAKLEAAIEKGLYDGTGDRGHYDRMLAKLTVSVTEYARLDAIATPAYRQATDLSEWFGWTRTRKTFESELAFYRQQATLARTGAEVVYVGLDGPMGDATNAFHWPLEHFREQAGWSAQSYCFGDDPLRRARLVVVYDMFSPAYKRLRPAIEAWVLRGGKLIFWDPLSRATEDPLLTGIRFWANSTYKPATKAAFADSPDPLLRGLSGVTVTVDPLARLCPSIHEASAEWHELAYTVLSNAAYLSLYDRLEPFGPTWVSMMGTARVPLVLARKHGAGSVVLAQLGVWAVRPPRETTSDAAQLAPSHLRRLTENIISWTRD